MEVKPDNPNSYSLTVNNLSHRYAKDWAIRNISFSLPRQGVIGLLGSNGAGKSTCMNAICGVLCPTEGEVQIAGKSIRKEPESAKSLIGFLPQQPPLYSEFTVDEYLRYCARLRRMPEAAVQRAVDVTKERVGISHFSNRLIGALSGGYRQRVGVAQAIIHEPSLVVLDEPTTGLDPNQILVVRDLIRSIAKERAVLMSTHILKEVEVVCEEIKMIEAGHIVFEGTIDEFVNLVPARSMIVRFDSAPCTSLLSSLPGIERAEAVSNQKIRFWLNEPDRAAEAIIRESTAHGWNLLEMIREKSSLEEVFASLSAQKRVDSSR